MSCRDLLKNSLEECATCRKFFFDNVGILNHEAGPFSEAQSAEILIMLNNYHLLHESMEDKEETIV